MNNLAVIHKKGGFLVSWWSIEKDLRAKITEVEKERDEARAIAQVMFSEVINKIEEIVVHLADAEEEVDWLREEE